VEAPLAAHHTNGVRLETKITKAGPNRVIAFTGVGPTHMTLVINASSAQLVKWPWTKTVPAPREDCNCHFVYFAGPPGEFPRYLALT
jgi:hypothetical protein